MFSQSAVGEAKPLHRTFLIDDVDDATSIQRVEPEVTYQNRNVGSDLYRGTRPIVPSPLPSRMRLWSTLYPGGAMVADAPTSG